MLSDKDSPMNARQKHVQPFGPAVPPIPLWLHLAFIEAPSLSAAEIERLAATVDVSTTFAEIEAELESIMRARAAS